MCLLASPALGEGTGGTEQWREVFFRFHLKESAVLGSACTCQVPRDGLCP